MNGLKLEFVKTKPVHVFVYNGVFCGAVVTSNDALFSQMNCG